MIFSNIKITRLPAYYVIGAISLICGYLIFVLSYLLSNDIIMSLLFQFTFTFIFKYFFYKKFVFKKFNTLLFLLAYPILFILNINLLKLIQDFHNIYIFQLIYMVSVSLLFFLILKKMNI
jgi:hypothetical protein